MKILVTGAEGFIGSHLVERLIEKKIFVKALIRYNFKNDWGWLDDMKLVKNKYLEIVSGDINDYKLIENISKDCSHIINLAALISIPYSYDAPVSNFYTNFNGVLNLLEIIKTDRKKILIHTSTSEVFGSAVYTPMDEKHPLQAQSPYAASKIAADQACMSYFHSYNAPIIILRPFNTYGPRQSNRAVIPTIINQILNKNKQLKIGSVFPTRDFTFVEDTVEAFICALNNKNIYGEQFNLGISKDFSIFETIKLISKLMNYDLKLKPEKIKKRPVKSEVNKLLSNNNKALQILKWKPKFTGSKGFERGLIKTIKWFEKNKNNNNLKEIYTK